jgi:SAM-dependent methyltransferase
VLATDLDPRLPPEDTRANLEIRRFDLVHDVLAPEDAGGGFDLVHARAVLEHIPSRQRALERLIAAVRPDGWLVVEDIDVAGDAMRATAERYAWPPAVRPVYERCFAALQKVLSDGERDPGYGAKLPAALREAGLHDVGAQLHPPVIAGGAPLDCMRLTFEYLSASLLATRLIDQDDLDQFLDLTRDSMFLYIPLFMVTAWGRRGNVEP